MRVLRALCGACYAASTEGSARAERRADALLVQAAALSKQLGTEAARAEACLVRALASFMLDRPEAVIEPSYEAERLYRSLARSEVDGNYYLRLAVVSARIGAFYQLSDYRAFAAQLHTALDEARATGNRAALLNLARNETLLNEIFDQTDTSIIRLEQQRHELPRSRFGVHHLLHMISVMSAACASGQYAWGFHYMEEDWPRFLRSPLRRAANLAFYARGVRTRLLLNRHLTTAPEGTKPAAQIASELSAMRAHAGQRSLAFVDAQRARVAYAQKKSELAIGLMRSACERLHTVAERERNRYALGIMLGADEGSTLCAEAERQLRELGVVNPANYVRGCFPELFAR